MIRKKAVLEKGLLRDLFVNLSEDMYREFLPGLLIKSE